jgi:hypothetical protein
MPHGTVGPDEEDLLPTILVPTYSDELSTIAERIPCAVLRLYCLSDSFSIGRCSKQQSDLK